MTYPGDLTYDDLGLEFSGRVQSGGIKTFSKNSGAQRRRFFGIREKPDVGRLNAPPPPDPARETTMTFDLAFDLDGQIQG